MNRDTVTAADGQQLAVVGRRLVYAVVVGNRVLALLYYRGLVPPVLAGLLYWGSGAALVVTIPPKEPPLQLRPQRHASSVPCASARTQAGDRSRGPDNTQPMVA